MISVLDDDVSVRLATVDLLNSYGFTCDSFGSAEEYLKSERAMDTSCLVLDLNMPGLNGLELQQRLAHSGRVVPIVFITAFPDEHTRGRAIDAGAQCYLPKPYSDEELIECIRQALLRQGGAAPQKMTGGHND